LAKLLTEGSLETVYHLVNARFEFKPVYSI